jgi:hypothetical protein
MVPQEVNAVNLPAMNALNFPAAILQPPYFDPKQPASMNYGAIGAIIGHEISHSFDDEGALFDASGKLQNWWTDSDFAHFRASAGQLVKEFDAYKPFPDLSINGQQTLSENIADVAGLAAAYSAYHLSLNGKSAPPVAGFTGDQQFFIAFGQSWREKAREPNLRQQIVTDGHAPARYRVETVRNIDAWYDGIQRQAGPVAVSCTDRARSHVVNAPTLAALATALAQGASSSRSLVEECLAHIDDPAGEGQRTFLQVEREGALAQADAVDALRACGAAPSAYAGIPISIKDLFDIAGQTTRAGSVALMHRPAATADATAVARLRQAGLILIGRTNMTEFAFSGLGLNPHYGTPLNPWNRPARHIPGGSSSGAAVSVPTPWLMPPSAPIPAAHAEFQPHSPAWSVSNPRRAACPATA